MIKRVLGFQNPTYLSLKLGQMVIQLPNVADNPNIPDELREKSVVTIPIEDIGVVVLDHKQVTITHALLSALMENNVAVITCDERHMPIGLMLPLDGNHIQTERFKDQIEASEPLRKQMWQQTVAAKIQGQAHLLGEQGLENNNMLAWAKQVRSGDTDNLEGRAAAYYWKTIFRNPDFVRGQDEAPPNNLLNYGYAIVRAMMARALVAAGLMPTLGIHHHNRYNAYCLADDIMEPYRPYVDRRVLAIISSHNVTEDLTSQLKRGLLSISTMEVEIEGHRSPMMIAIQTTANSVQRCFEGEARKIIYPDW